MRIYDWEIWERRNFGLKIEKDENVDLWFMGKGGLLESFHQRTEVFAFKEIKKNTVCGNYGGRVWIEYIGDKGRKS